jgi:hypothetical protein
VRTAHQRLERHPRNACAGDLFKRRSIPTPRTVLPRACRNEFRKAFHTASADPSGNIDALSSFDVRGAIWTLQ